MYLELGGLFINGQRGWQGSDHVRTLRKEIDGVIFYQTSAGI